MIRFYITFHLVFGLLVNDWLLYFIKTFWGNANHFLSTDQKNNGKRNASGCELSFMAHAAVAVM